MSEGGGGEGGQEKLLRQGQLWALFNSDNSGGDTVIKPPESSSNSLSGPAPGATVSAGGKRASDGASKSSSSKGGSQEGKGPSESDHEMHIWTERERRKKMRNMFTSLHALLPHLPPKADKSTIVDEAVKYIKKLEQNVQKLEKQKEERIRGATSEEPSSKTQGMEMTTREAFMADQVKNWAAANSPTAVSIPRCRSSFQTWTSPNVVLNVTGSDAHISICTAKKPGILSAIVYVLERHKLEVVSAQISSNRFRSMIMIHAHATGVSDQFPEMLMIEDLYKYAVGEILLWLTP
ncbi:transcription factor bHLH95 [Elaeis guineensis]|uniref:Transcription factor bHLH95 n=1 Tax=Elaeis guineensis var. tenera TaxID=51953 RepID=A0A6I9RRK7_ELAGV|nr:transcription factor bHLH95 [Elaeis guineensis]